MDTKRLLLTSCFHAFASVTMETEHASARGRAANTEAGRRDDRLIDTRLNAPAHLRTGSVVSPFARRESDAPARAESHSGASEPQDSTCLSASSSVRLAGVGQSSRSRLATLGAAVALGLGILGAATPALAQAATDAATTSQRQVTPSSSGTPSARSALAATQEQGSSSTEAQPPPPLPPPRPQDPSPLRMNITRTNHASFDTQIQSYPGSRYAYGTLDVGHQYALELDQGPWRSETFTDASTQLRVGTQLDEPHPAGSISAGMTLGENLSRDLGNGFSAYGHAQVRAQAGTGTQFDNDTPLDAVYSEEAIGAQHTDGVTTIYAEPFAQQVHTLNSAVGHNRYGVRVGATHQVTETDQVRLEVNSSHYSYSNGEQENGVGVEAGWLHKTGHVWWGPEVGVEHRSDNDNRLNVGISVKF